MIIGLTGTNAREHVANYLKNCGFTHRKFETLENLCSKSVIEVSKEQAAELKGIGYTIISVRPAELADGDDQFPDFHLGSKITDYKIIDNGELVDLLRQVVEFCEKNDLYLKDDSKKTNWDRYFMNIVQKVSENSRCVRRKVGAVLVKNKRIIATGYNGSPAGTPHCYEKGGCLREKLNVPSGQRDELCRGAHAEKNSIDQCARFGIACDGSIMYIENFPCSICTKSIINAGIAEVVYAQPYNSELSAELLAEAKIKVRRIK